MVRSLFVHLCLLEGSAALRVRPCFQTSSRACDIKMTINVPKDERVAVVLLAGGSGSRMKVSESISLSQVFAVFSLSSALCSRILHRPTCRNNSWNSMAGLCCNTPSSCCPKYSRCLFQRFSQITDALCSALRNASLPPHSWRR